MNSKNFVAPGLRYVHHAQLPAATLPKGRHPRLILVAPFY